MTPARAASFWLCLLTATTSFLRISEAAVTVPPVSANFSSVTAVEGATAVLPAEFSRDYKVFAQTWNKLMRGVRTAVYMYGSSKKTSMSLGPLKDRAILDPDGSLRIMAAKKSDEGLYVLSSVLDVVGQEDHYVRLAIFVLPIVGISTANPVVAMEASSVTLNCSVNHTSALTSPPYWESAQLYDVSPHILGNMVADDNYSPWLFLPKVSREQTGNYSCVAEHVMGKTSDSIYVNVIYPAKIMKIAEDNSDDNNVVLHCIAEGNPSPRVSWYRGYSLQPRITTTGTDTFQRLGLVLSKHNNMTSGQYRCEATNDLAVDSKSVYVSIYQKAVTIVEAAESNGIIRVREGSLFQVITTAGIAAASLCLLLVVLLAGFIFCRKRPDMHDQQEFEYIAGHRENIPMEQFGNDTSLPAREQNGEQTMMSPADRVNASLSVQNGISSQCRTFDARVIVPYYSHQPGFLSLKINDFVEVIDQTSSGWLFGSIGERSGVFPATCVEPSGRTNASRKNNRNKFMDKQGHQAPFLIQIPQRTANDGSRVDSRPMRCTENTTEENS